MFSAHGQTDPVISFELVNESDTTSCTSQNICFINTSQHVDDTYSFTWSFGDDILYNQPYSEINEEVCYSYDDVGEYTITLTATAASFEKSVEIDITVKQTPEVDLLVSPTHIVEPNRQINLTISHVELDSMMIDFGDGYFSKTAISSHSFDEPGDYDVTFSGYKNGCVGTDIVTVNFEEASPFSVMKDNNEGCAPLTDTLTAATFYADYYRWTIDDNTTLHGENPVFTFEEPGTHLAVLEARRAGSQTYKYVRTDTIVVYPPAVADFTFSPDTIMLPNQAVRVFDNSENSIKYNWDFGDGTVYGKTFDNSDESFEPAHYYEKAGLYSITLEVWSETGCYDSKTIEQAVFVKPPGTILFPTAFTPNTEGEPEGYYIPGDYSNDVFLPIDADLSGIQSYTLQIYNWQGRLLFESKDILKGWTGYYEGKLCPLGSYLWYAKGTFENGISFEKRGELLLLR